MKIADDLPRQARKTFVRSTLLAGLILSSFVFASNGPQPSVGLYWFQNSDPTLAGGVSAPLNQLLIRTDSPSLYYKSGPSATAWTQIGNTLGLGGTVTSVVCGVGVLCSPNPIVAAGAVTLNVTPTTCPPGSAEISTAANGTSICGPVITSITGDAGVYVATNDAGGAVVTLNVTPTTCPPGSAEISTAANGTSICGPVITSITGDAGIYVTTDDAGGATVGVATGDGIVITAGRVAVATGDGIVITAGRVQANVQAGLFGDGSDGVCAFDGSTTVQGFAPVANVYTVTRPLNCSTGAVATGVRVKAFGVAIRFATSLTDDGTGRFEANGNSGVNNIGGVSVGGGTWAAVCGNAGGAGGATFGTAAGSCNGTCRGLGAAGAGGNGVSGTGGAGGVETTLAVASGDCIADWAQMYHGNQLTGAAYYCGCSGGGGGGTNVGTGEGGGGGSPGGPLAIFARQIFGTGTSMFQVVGGGGGSRASVGCTSGSNGCGGGGGGTGGYLLLIYGSFGGSGCTLTQGSCYTVAGGVGGAHTGTGVAATDGVTGGLGTAIVQQAN